MSVIIPGYWSGYLSGFLAGGLVSWVLTSLTNNETNDLEDMEEIFENERGECDTSENLHARQHQNGNSDSNMNEFHIKLTDKTMAILLDLHSRDHCCSTPTSVNYNCDCDVPVAEHRPEEEDHPEREMQYNESVYMNVDAHAHSHSQEEEHDLRTIHCDVDEEDEMTGIFEENSKAQTRTVEETLNVGRKLETRPIAFPTSKGGGYATMDQLDEIGKRNAEFKDATLSRADELEIIHAFRGILNQNFYEANESVQAQGYSLYPLYIGNEKRPGQIYSGTVLGVRIEDEDFNGVPSVNAVITEIVDVGGIDAKNRGMRK